MTGLSDLRASVGKARVLASRVASGVSGPWKLFLNWAWGHGVVRRILVVTAASLLVFFGLAVVVVVQQPFAVANSVVQRMFGKSGDGTDPSGSSIPDFCVSPPREAHPSVMPPVATTVTVTPKPGPDGRPGTPTAVPTVVRAKEPPPPVLDTNNKPTPEALRMIREIPKSSDIYAAQAYLLYRAAHPRGDFPRDWQDWIDSYYAGLSSLSSQATPLDVVTTLDHDADYRPYVLFSLSATYRLARDGYLATDERRASLVLEQLDLVCQRGMA